MANYGVSAATAISALLLTPFLISRLGVVAFGVYALASTVVGYLDVFELGFGGATTKLVAEDAGRHPAGVIRTLNTSIAVLSALAVPALIVGAILAVYVPGWIGIGGDLANQTRILIAVLAFALAVSMPADAFGGALSAHQRYDLGGVANILLTVLTAAASVAAILLGGGLVGLAIAAAAVSILMHVLRFAFLRRLVPGLRLSRHLVDRTRIPEVARVAGWLFAGGLFFSAAAIDLIVVGAARGAAEVTVYAVGFKLSQLVARLLDRLTAAYMPHASSLAARADLPGLRRLLVDGTRTSLAVGLPVTLLLVILAPPIVSAWVGPGYGDSATVLMVLAASGAAYAWTLPSEQLLIGCGQLRRYGLAAAAYCVVNIATSVVLVRVVGVYGPAIGTLAATALVLAPIQVTSALRRSATTLRMLAGQALWPLLFPCAVLGGAAFGLRSVAGHSLAGLILAVLIASAGYLISYIAVAASPRERLFLRRLIRLRAAR
jgi:O-antigen/teichoic acid export membrane protein